jgi:hypothetical protein
VNTVLIVVTLVEVLLLVVVLAGYLIAIAATLRNISKTLGLVTFGVRAIETQTASIGPNVLAVNAALEQVAGALHDVVGDQSATPTTVAPEGSGGVDSRDDLPRPGTS